METQMKARVPTQIQGSLGLLGSLAPLAYLSILKLSSSYTELEDLEHLGKLEHLVFEGSSSLIFTGKDQ